MHLPICRRRAAVLVALCLAGCGLTSARPGGESHSEHLLSFPPLALAPGERIEAVEIVATCARFRKVPRIFDDWGLEVSIPESEVSTLTATAGHGTSMLDDATALHGFVTLAVVAPACFDVRARLTIFRTERERLLTFDRAELHLDPPVAR